MKQLRSFFSVVHLCLLLWIGTLTTAVSQEFIGQHSSNYAGINRATFNPSAIAGTRYRYHINLVSFNTTVNNRYFKYFRSDALFHPFRNAYAESDMYGKSKLTGTLTQGDNVNVLAELRTPSGYVGVGKNNWLVVGFQTRLRGFVQGSGVPSAIFDAYKYRLDDGLTTAATGSFTNFTMNQHSFFETGLTVAAMPLRLDGLIRLKVGATIKRLSGARNVFLTIKNANYQVKPLNATDYVMELGNVSYEYGYTQPVQAFSLGNLFSSDYGSGTAIDLGATVEIGRIQQHAENQANYIARIGVALTDAGQISYPSTGKQYSGSLSKLTINQNQLIDIGNNSVKGLETLLGTAKPVSYASSTALPRTLNVDADVQLAKSFFVNATWIKPTNVGSLPTHLAQPQVFSLTPRFEGEDVEFTLPVTWWQGNDKPTIGFSVRFGPAYIGFSNFGGLVSKAVQPRGSLAYFGIQLWGLNDKKD